MDGGMGQAEARAQVRAAMLRVQFVNTQTTSWLTCDWGMILQFVEEASAMAR
jgi:hypothetical protein